MKLIKQYKNMSKQGKLNIQCAVVLILLSLNVFITTAIITMLSDTIEIQNQRIEYLERRQDTVNANLLKLIADKNGVGG